MFVSTDAKRPYPRGVIGSTVGTYPRGTGSNLVEGMGTFFPHTVSSVFRLSLTHTHTHTHTRTHTDWRCCFLWMLFPLPQIYYVVASRYGKRYIYCFSGEPSLGIFPTSSRFRQACMLITTNQYPPLFRERGTMFFDLLFYYRCGNLFLQATCQ